MEYKIITTEEQEKALSRCDWTPQRAFDDRIAPVVESLRLQSALDTLAVVESDPTLKAAVGVKLTALEEKVIND